MGRLKNCKRHWEKIGSNSSVLDVITSGYKLPLMIIPQKVALNNNLSARSNPEFHKNGNSKFVGQKMYLYL